MRGQEEVLSSASALWMRLQYVRLGKFLKWMDFLQFLKFFSLKFSTTSLAKFCLQRVCSKEVSKLL